MNNIINLRVGRVLLTCGAGLVTFSVAAADLNELYQQAKQRDPLWASAQATQQARVETEEQAQAGLLPTINFNASYTRNEQEVTMASTTNSQYPATNYSLNLTQPIFRKTNNAKYSQSQYLAKQADADLMLAQQDLILRTSSAYFAVLSAEDQKEFARTEKNALSRQLALAKRQFEVGSGSLIDRHTVQARYDLVVADEIAADTALLSAQQQLRANVGEVNFPLAKLTVPMTMPPLEPANVEPWIKTGMENSAQIRSAQLNEQASQEGITISRSVYYPSVDFVASHSYSDSYNVFNSPMTITTNTVGIALNYPIYAGGADNSRIRESLARHEAQRQNLEYVRRQTERDIRQIYLQVTTGMARIQALEQAQNSNQKALESMLIGYERGQRTGTDVVNAQRELFRTKRDLSTARYDYLLAQLRLKAAAGQLAEADIQQLNTQLDR